MRSLFVYGAVCGAGVLALLAPGGVEWTGFGGGEYSVSCGEALILALLLWAVALVVALDDDRSEGGR